MYSLTNARESIKSRDSELLTNLARLMLMIVRNIGFLLTSLLLAGQALAQASSPDVGDSPDTDQGLALFDDIETSQSRTRETDRPSRESRVTASDPEFTLIGTSRIGASYSAILRHRSGENVLVRSDGSTSTPIEDYAGYSVAGIGAGSLSLSYPGSVPCVDFPEQGVGCNSSSNTADLQLTNGEPLLKSVSLTGAATQIEVLDAEGNAGVATSGNPFEALRDARANGNNPAQNATQNVAPGVGATAESGRFTPRRISPEDIPPGMRVVATPFGDRLVEE